MKILSAHNYRNKHFFKKRETLKKKKKKRQKCGNKDYQKFILERQSLNVNGTTTHVVRFVHTHARKTGNFQTKLVIFSHWVTYEIVLNPFSSSLLHDHVPLITAEAFRTRCNQCFPRNEINCIGGTEKKAPHFSLITLKRYVKRCVSIDRAYVLGMQV